MTLGDKNEIFTWEAQKEDDKGYYFVLTDTLHHLDYNVILMKDDDNIMVNGDYIKNIPNELAMAILPRIDYFKTVNKIHNDKKEKHDEKKKEKK